MICEQLRRLFSIASPLARTVSSSILPYQFEPDSDPEDIEQEGRAEPLHAQILQDILKYIIFNNYTEQSLPLEIQWYKNTRTGFRFWNVQCSTKQSPHPPTIRISVGRIYFCDITQENNFVSKRAIRCSSWKAQKKKRNISLWSGLWDL